ncbi:SLC13 family permease [Mesonia ostreae]|uniref:DASS family sodium-coupled anion symporter n=1 Tax=Mesonia ostreae TaxID=861110 RepID=A0ABU2KG80_9FLAO|nr:DASS family sodium-coupled anion symporter [Mesonia ostreae]MDT0293691.1 DASS family sodium-coupled anion symporter [Mesonia ostreae]
MGSNDSRRSSFKYYRDKTLGRLFNTSTFLGNVVIAFLVTYFIPFEGFTPAMDCVLFLTVLALGLWITEAIPPFAVGIFIIGYLVFTLGSDYFLETPMPIDDYVGAWTSDVIWLLLGGFFLAEGMKRVELDRTLFRFTVRRFGTKPKRLLYGLMMMTAVASMFMSNTATAAMMIGSIMPLVSKLGKENPFTRSLLIGIPAAASVGGIGTIIGSTPNAIVVGALETIGVKITFLTWMVFGVPLALFLVWSFWKYLSSKNITNVVDLDLSFLDEEPEHLVPVKEKWIVIITLFFTVLLWSTESLHGIPLAATSAVPIVVLTLTSIISADQVRGLPWDTLMLVAGGLALGLAIVDVGLAHKFIVMLKSFNFPLLLLAIIFGYLTLGMSNVMSNTAAAAILIPITLGLPGIYQVSVPLIIALSASCALFLPVSTPPNAIAYSTNLVNQKDFRIGGIYFAGVAPIFIFPLGILVAYLLSLGFSL